MISEKFIQLFYVNKLENPAGTLGSVSPVGAQLQSTHRQQKISVSPGVIALSFAFPLLRKLFVCPDSEKFNLIIFDRII